MRVEIAVNSPQLARYASALGGPERIALHEAMGLAVREGTRDYLRLDSATRHKTADRLGGERTGHMERAAQAVEGAPVDADSEGATLTINHPGLSRAFHDVTITAGAKLLPIPLNGLAYGHSPLEFAKVTLLRRAEGGTKTPEHKRKPLDPSIPAYLLVTSVTQLQDRTLLPSDAEWTEMAKDGARTFIAAL
jgi:hypothetical protein